MSHLNLKGCFECNRTPLIRTLVIRFANYPDCTASSYGLKFFPQMSDVYNKLYINILSVRK